MLANCHFFLFFSKSFLTSVSLFLRFTLKHEAGMRFMSRIYTEMCSMRNLSHFGLNWRYNIENGNNNKKIKFPHTKVFRICVNDTAFNFHIHWKLWILLRKFWYRTCAVFHKTTVSFLTKQRDRLSFMSGRTFAKCLNKVINFNVLINKFGIGQGTSKGNSDGNSGSLFYKLDFSSCAMAFRNPVLFIN